MAEQKENKKGSVKAFWKKNKSIVMPVAAFAVGTACMYLYGQKRYVQGFVDGGNVGFQLTLDWLDKTFPSESNANALYERFKAEHPDQIVRRLGPGKWA